MAITTVRTHPTTICATASVRPSRGANSTARNSKNALRGARASAIAAMSHLDGSGHPNVHGLRRRTVEPHPDREALCDHNPVEIAPHLGKTRAVLVARLHSHPED